MNIQALHPDVSHVVAISGFLSVEQIIKDSFSGLLAFAAGVLFALPVPKKLKALHEHSEAMYLMETVLLVLLFAVSVVFMVNSTYNSFIYFQF